MHTYRLRLCTVAVLCTGGAGELPTSWGEGASLTSQCHKSFIESFFSPATLGITQEAVQGKSWSEGNKKTATDLQT